MPAHRIITYLWAAAIAAVLIIATQPAPVAPAESLLRLHVRANSNHPSDQALKYQVRDAVLDVLYVQAEGAADLDEAQARVTAVLPELVAAAESVVAAAGFDYPVSATLGEADFPTRLYGDLVYRAGRYQALQIYLGEGSGENWWCVLFPPLCFVEAAPDSALPVAGHSPKPPRPRSRLVEWFQRMFSQNK